jgi:pimeloyl-ACP methyl ester carboxylesterase
MAARELTIPTLITHSRDDRTIPLSHAHELERAVADNPKSKVWIRRSGAHGALSGRYKERIKMFFDAALKKHD